MRTGAKSALLFLVAAVGLIGQGCGGGAGVPAQIAGPAPTVQTKTEVAQHLSNAGTGLLFNSFTAFAPNIPVSGGPTFDKRLGLWVVTKVTLTTYTLTFFQDQAETEPAGSADYILNVSTETLAGAINITKGNYAGLSGTYSATKSGNTIIGNEALTLPNGNTVASQFSVTING